MFEVKELVSRLNDKVDNLISILSSDTFSITNTTSTIAPSFDGNYYVSVADSIARILSTHLGSRVMRPNFGSRLYELRDRNFDNEWRLNATRYIYEAIEKDEPRVKLNEVGFEVEPISGVIKIKLYLDKGIVEYGFNKS